MSEEASVKVAVRIRPQIPRELIELCHVCTSVTPGEPQVWLGKDKAFTFDNVFDMSTHQETIYEACIRSLIDGCFEGYNATVLAYGQTGSGKTYTMGTGFDVSIGPNEVGIIPRAVDQLFRGISARQNEARDKGYTPPEFKVVAQFMELYNEEIIDLLDTVIDASDKFKKSHIKIHEDVLGGIYTVGLTSRAVTSSDETLQCLKIGALSRTTASTQMNVQSSRSHAIFTLHITQQRKVNMSTAEELDGNQLEEFETLSAKFHFVDLAGSERLKRTGATGDRAKEGISINCGLLALGNVISALGDKTRRASHVPYRDSKLTRLLQDSLGGNSQTLMIACVSPSDRDFMETLNTLKYANRAKNIKNKISINQDKSSQTISILRREIQQLQLELMEYKQGKRLVGDDGTEQINDMFHENTMLQTENNNLRTRLKALQESLDHQTNRIVALMAEKTAGSWIVSGNENSQSEITELIKGYLSEVEDLRAKLLQSEEVCSQLRKQLQKAQTRLSFGNPLIANGCFSNEFDLNTSSTCDILSEAKEEIKKLKKRAKVLEGNSSMEKGSKEELHQGSDDEKSSFGEAEFNGESNFDNEEESSDESDSEEKGAEEAYSGDLAELTWDISMKQRLIEALEQSQQRLRTMKHHYEEKLLQLERKIRETEMERDRVLVGLSQNKENRSEEKVKKVKEEFERKLSTLQNELKKMKIAKKEHAQLMRNQSQYERQINQLKNEVMEMKKTKVRLINKMKEETQRHKYSTQRVNREIAQLKKQSRIQENRISSLETEKRKKENILRRKQEEVIALRKMAKPMSDSVAGRVNPMYQFKKQLSFSSKVAKSRWQQLEKNINQLVINKQSVYNIERDMERYLQERERLTRKLEVLERRKNKAVKENKDEAAIQDYAEQIENLKANIDYCQENISDCQSSIMQMEEAKGDMDILDVKNLLYRLSFEEAKYLMEKLLSMVIHQTFQVVQKDATIKEIDAKLKQTMNNNTVHVQLLELLVQESNPEMLDFLNTDIDQYFDSRCSTRSSSPIDSSYSEVTVPTTGNEPGRIKAGRKTGLPSEFLNATVHLSLPPAGSCPIVSDVPEKPATPRLAWSFGPALQQELEATSVVNSSTGNSDRGIVRVTSAPTSLKEMAYSKSKPEKSPLARRKGYDKQLSDISPAFRRKFYTNASVIPPPSLSRQSSVETTMSDVTPPNSPTSVRKTRDDNVFSRLTSGSFRSNKPGRGVITPFVSKTNAGRGAPLICTHTAEGHSRAVLSIAATDEVLFSSSKDRTVKIWDLTTGTEIQSLGGHPNNVVSVQYSEYSRLAFSVSMAYIKVWDVRENPGKCIKTLCSSGVNSLTSLPANAPSRTLLMPHGETQIHDIALNRYGSILFSAAGNIVRMWDLRMYQAVGKLSGGHQAAVMCLAVDNKGLDKNLVVTGSKDHYIKVFEVMENSSGSHSARMNLEPPHYDGIQSLAINEDVLFSGSRDMCIKKWDLKTGNHVQSLNQAHKDWVCALCFLSNSEVILSGCRGGFIKLWTTDSTQLIGEIRAHSAPINAISVNNSSVFTASTDCTIGIWRLRNSSDISPDYNDGAEQ